MGVESLKLHRVEGRSWNSRRSYGGTQLDVGLIQERLRAFARDRDWEQYHTPKNLSMALAGEAAELMEIFQWLTPEESLAVRNSEEQMGHVRDELADVAIYLLRLADILQVDLESAVLTKIEKNAVKYPAPSSGSESWTFRQCSGNVSG